MSKIQGKFEINYDHYLTDKSKLIYVENRIRKKVLQHLEPYLRLNLITFFTIIENLFNHLKNIFGNSHEKKHAIEKFQNLKIGFSSFKNFYSEFIYLASDLEYISEIFIKEFKYKLTLCL